MRAVLRFELSGRFPRVSVSKYFQLQLSQLDYEISLEENQYQIDKNIHNLLNSFVLTLESMSRESRSSPFGALLPSLMIRNIAFAILRNNHAPKASQNLSFYARRKSSK